MDFAQCRVQAVGCCCPCSNPNGTARGCVFRGSSVLQPQSPEIFQPFLAAAKSQDLHLTALEHWRYTSLVLTPVFTHKELKEEHAGDLAVTQSWDKTHTHTHKGVHVPEGTRDSSTSLFLPQKLLITQFCLSKKLR